MGLLNDFIQGVKVISGQVIIQPNIATVDTPMYGLGMTTLYNQTYQFASFGEISPYGYNIPNPVLGMTPDLQKPLKGIQEVKATSSIRGVNC